MLQKNGINAVGLSGIDGKIIQADRKKKLIIMNEKGRKQAIDKGHLVPGDGKNAEQWSSANKFVVVLETATLNQAELAEYCRKKGLYAEQIAAWRSACMDANANVKVQEKAFSIEAKKDKKQINQLEKELRRKDKALAETAALLVLRKKANAIWGEDEDE